MFYKIFDPLLLSINIGVFMNQEVHDTESVNPLVLFAINHPKMITRIMTVITLVLITTAALPNFFPKELHFLNTLQVDTDPENMLSPDEEARVYNAQMKKEFSLSDIVVVGITNDFNEKGVFNPSTLSRIHQLTQFALSLHWQDEETGKSAGVIGIDLLSPSTVDNIEQGGLGSVNFSWLMAQAPKTQEEALAIRDRAKKIPFLDGTLISDDSQALAIYIPITDKHLSYEIREKLLARIAEFGEIEEEYYITGLPVAEDTFGVEMFKQMAISAPIAMLVIFLMLWWFFKRLIFVTSPMILAMVCALSTMAILIITGHTIHIMSSMIPIFIMPIAILDAVHILSDFFDKYNQIQDKRKTIIHVMNELYTPMLITTLTTIAGFASLALTPIPPVQTFGIFIAIGVFLAWIWSITFIPAFIVMIPDEKLAGFINTNNDKQSDHKTLMGRLLAKVGDFTYNHALLIVLISMSTIGIAAYGISKINVNDNPIKWFNAEHPIRVADRVLNDHFGGTYMAYLALEVAPSKSTNIDFKPAMIDRLNTAEINSTQLGLTHSKEIFGQLRSKIQNHIGSKQLLEIKSLEFIDKGFESSADNEFDTWDKVQLFIDSEQQRNEIFKQPDALNYLAGLQNFINNLDVVGKSNSLSDVIKTVHRELLLGKAEEFRIPDSPSAVAQTLITYQNSHRPHDLWHFVTPDYRKTSLWVQLTSGDNQDMAVVEQQVADYITAHPMPHNLQAKWFGLTHINVVWQDKMVTGMFESFTGSFIVVLLMMILLFRSFFWGLLSMVPLTLTVGLIYGFIGLIGKDYDMPVAVLSSLSIGLAVDYAIHFLSRAREYTAYYGSWEEAIGPLFSEPAMAISRNAIVVGVGFLPLLAAPLVPYQTVGFFIASILFLAGITSLLLLPAIISLMPGLFFRNLKQN